MGPHVPDMSPPRSTAAGRVGGVRDQQRGLAGPHQEAQTDQYGPLAIWKFIRTCGISQVAHCWFSASLPRTPDRRDLDLHDLLMGDDTASKAVLTQGEAAKFFRMEIRTIQNWAKMFTNFPFPAVDGVRLLYDLRKLTEFSRDPRKADGSRAHPKATYRDELPEHIVDMGRKLLEERTLRPDDGARIGSVILPGESRGTPAGHHHLGHQPGVKKAFDTEE